MGKEYVNGKVLKYKKRIRLKSFDYKGLYPYFVTICCYNKNKREIFLKREVVEMCLDMIKKLSEEYKFSIWAYCFMPTHLHILTQGDDVNSDFRKFISQFKQQTSFIYKAKTGEKIWQINYYEHVLRKEEDMNDVAEYIWGNPVRKGIVEDYRKYQYNGSFKINLKEM